MRVRRDMLLKTNLAFDFTAMGEANQVFVLN
jgi:hypothetical protein